MTHTMDMAEAVTSALGFGAAGVLPEYSQLTHACRGKALEEANALAECRRVAALLERGDTYKSESVGAYIAKEVWPQGSPEYRAAVQARRAVHYLMYQEMQVSLKARWDEAFAGSYLRRVGAHRTEQEVALALIANPGLSANPPDEWIVGMMALGET